MPSQLSRNEEDSDKLQENLSLNVPKTQGESAIQILSKLNLLSRKLAPQTTGDMLHVPLSRAPQPEEQKKLDRALGEQNLSKEKFPSVSPAVGSLEEVLARQLPSSIIPLVSKSFDVIGDIAIIELSPATEPFEKDIAEALMKVHKNIKTVYSKAGPITDNQRLRPLHHVLGAFRTETIHKELGCRFKIDISKVFFSPRLSAEHKRVAEQVRPGECVVDMFAGVGPFSILIAKRSNDVQIHAIDANPEAAKLIGENARMNKVQDRIRVWEGDARVVVKNSLSGVATRELAAALDNSDWKIEKLIETRKVRGVAPLKWQIVIDAKLAPA